MERIGTMNKALTIVLPCYNPISKWEENLLYNCKAIIKNLPDVSVEIILVNDGSQHGINSTNIDFLKSEILSFKYIQYNKNKGKRFAVREGFKHASHENIIFTDIDFPYKLDGLIAMSHKLFNAEGDIIVGVRSKDYYKNVPFHRRFISKTLIKLNKILLNLPVGETQAGLKGFSLKGKEAMLLSTINGYLFDIEVLKIGKKNSCKIIGSQVALRDDVIFSSMGIKLLVKEFKNFIKILFT